MPTKKRSSNTEIELGKVKGLISNLEDTQAKPKDPKTWKKPKCEGFFRFMSSKFMSLVFGPLYGIGLYFYITHLVLSGLPLLPTPEGIIQGYEYPSTIEPLGNGSFLLNGTVLADDVQYNGITNETLSMIIGGSIGGGTGVGLTLSGLFSRRVRAAMLLMIPSLLSRRGRAFMITAAVGILLSGPVNTIDNNVQQVVTSLTCLYENVKFIAEQYVEQLEAMLDQLKLILQQINQLIRTYQRQMTELANSATEETRRKIEKSKEEIKKQVKKYKEKLDDLKDVLEAPGKAAEWFCNAGDSALSWTEGAVEDAGDWFEGAAEDVGDFFSSWRRKRRRKKRASCDVPPVVPDIDINVPDVNLDAIKDFIKKLKPGVDLVNFNWDSVLPELKKTSIADIRERLKTILKSIFEIVEKYSMYVAKIFYLSVVLIIWDAIWYLHKYYSDDSFDNKFVDDNLRRLWWSGEKEKILPLRKWELNEKYQNSVSLKLSKEEAKRILIQSIPSLLFAITTAAILAVDVSLSSILTLFKEEAQFGISFDGMERGVSFESLLPGLQSGKIDAFKLKLRGFNLTTDKCLPAPETTNHAQTGIIGAIIIVCLLSCIFDAYASRLRGKVCNLCFSVRALERARYLYQRIQTGRMARHIQLQMIVNRELDLRERKNEFHSTWKRFKHACGCRMTKEPCPACHHNICGYGKQYAVKKKDQKRETTVCDDCFKDV